MKSNLIRFKAHEAAGASSRRLGRDIMNEIARKQKILEINPRSPLIEGLLRRIESLPEEDGAADYEEEKELQEVATILIDGALIRSGFDVADTNL